MVNNINGRDGRVVLIDRKVSIVSRLQWVLVVWILAVIAHVVNAVFGIYNVYSLNGHEQLVRHTRDVQVGIADILSDMIDAETGNRGFIITSDPTYLVPYRVVKESLPIKQQSFRQLISDNPEQLSRFSEVESLIRDRIAIFEESITFVEKGNQKAAVEALRSGKGMRVMNLFRQRIKEMDKAEDTLLNNRTIDATTSFRVTVATNIVGTSIALAIIGLAYYVIARELQRRVQAETEIRSINERLESTIELRAKALTQTSTELMRSNQELEKFAYVASHDLQEPLRKIQAFGDRLKQKAGDVLNEACRDYVDRMQSSATRMRTLINDLLAYSRVTSQGRPFAIVDLSELVAGVISDLEPAIDDCGGRIEINALPNVHADPTQMRQLFQNLLVNALKFRKPGVVPEVTVRAIPASDLSMIAIPPPPTTGWRITVTDNGIGFDPAYSERIFELFQRLHGRGEYDGTGIGLAVCRKIVERHSGQIIARGRPGEGAEFLIDLPDLANPVGAIVS